MLAQNNPPMMDPHNDNNGYQMPHMAGPPMMNHQPQMYGAYTADGMPTMGMPDMSQQMYGDGSMMDDSIEAKRRRIARVSSAVIAGRTGD